MINQKAKRENILFVAYHYPPAGGTGIPAVQRVIKFIRYLDGYKVSVLSVKPEYYPEYISTDNKIPIPTKNEKIYRTRTLNVFEFILKVRNKIIGTGGNKEKGIKKCNNIQTPVPAKIRTRPHDKGFQHIKDILSSMINFPDFANPWLIPAVITGIKVIRENKVDIIFATGMPWTSLIVGFFLKVFTGRRLIIDFRDPWVNNPFHEKNTLERYLEKKFERLIIKKADIISANTERLRQELKARYPNKRNSIICLPNGYDETDFFDLPTAPVHQKEKLIISHAGFLYGKRDPYFLIKVIQTLYKIRPQEASRIEFHQIGNVNLTYDFEKISLERGLKDNFRFLKQMDYKQCLSYLKSSDVLLVVQPGTKIQIPSKLYEYIYIEKPIIAITEQGGALGQLITTYGFGKVFETSMVKEIADYLLFLIDIKTQGDQLRLDYRNKARFDIREITRQLQEQVNQL